MKNLRIAFLLVLALAAFSGSSAAQSTSGGDHVLVAGDPPLKQSDINILVDFYEWLFEAKFTAAERSRFQTLLVSETKAKPAASGKVAEIVAGFKGVETIGAEKSGQVRREFLPQIVGTLRESSSEINLLLLGVYAKARGETSSGNAAISDRDGNVNNDDGAVKIADLAGIWTTGSVSSERYKSLATGELTAPSGSLIEYEIKPNGRVIYASYYSNSFYSCTNQMFVHKTGRVSVNGSRLTFDYAPGSRTNVPCAAAKREATIPAERKTASFRLERDEYGVKLCLTENDAEVCLRKAR